MGALDVILRLLKPGDEIIAGTDLYGGSNRLLTYIKQHNGIHTHHLDTTNPKLLLPYLTGEASAHDPAAKGNVTLVLLETPTNPLLQIVDIKTIADMVHQHRPDAIVVVDNTMMSPYLMRPLEHGADIVYDSGTKYLSGHHDLMAGVITCNRDDIHKGIAFMINSTGVGLPPFDCFLLLRGIKTLAIRLDRQQASAIRVAEYLNKLGFKVNFPGLAGHPGKEIHDKLADGPGAVLSFETGDKQLSEKIVGAARLWGISVSFGCVNSLISMPCLMSHASIDPKIRAERNLPEDLIRLCVGIEDADDLIDDLEAALLEAGAVRVVDEAGERATLERVGTIGSITDALDKVTVETADLVVSAPGKVILYGEHSVVYGIPAIAGAVDLRCYAHTAARADNKVSLHLPDLDFSHEWEIDALPWGNVTPSAKAPAQEGIPDAILGAKLAGLAPGAQTNALASVQAFLYLYMSLSVNDRPAQAITLRSSLPIGAGLGSSAAYSVCIAASLLYTHGHLPRPAAGKPLLPGQADVINAWAFLAEKIIHGTPSGIDNTVASLGGAIVYTKAVKGKEGGVESVKGFDAIRFLITDTRVGRDTKTLVLNVAKRRLEEPDTILPILDKMGVLTAKARTALASTTISRNELLTTLSQLADENHAHLNSLGVGHPALEAVKRRAAAAGLVTKLTGAGGGGCAVTIVPDDFPEAELSALKAGLAGDGFVAYETAVGGSGLGVLTGLGEKDVSVFGSTLTAGLPAWASGAGEWAFV